MKRDMGLIQAILEELERAEASWCLRPDTLPGYNNAALVLYHFNLCVQANFVRKVPRGVQITWLGHEHLDQVRNSQD